jgi:hypothetical protein
MGTSDAERFTVSFYVKSNKTGTGIVEAQMTSGGASVEYSRSFTISQANTWEKKSVTIIANTSLAQDNKTNSTGLTLYFILDSGTNQTTGTLPTTWADQTFVNRWAGHDLAIGRNADDYMEMTGLQVDIGDVAQAFKYESFEQNLARCQRYYQVFASGDNVPITNASLYNTQYAFGFRPTYVPMRAAPTLVQVTGSNAYHFFNANTNDTFDDFVLDQSFSTGVNLMNQDTISGTQGDGGWFQSNSSSGLVAVVAEL